MRNLNFDNRKINYDKLIEYGFVQTDNDYCLRRKICNNQFEVIIEILEDKKLSYVMDLINGDEYIIVDVKKELGEFASNIKTEYEKIINEVINTCTTLDIFKSKQAKYIINYIKDKYNTELEFLWEDENNAVLRNYSNNKWYGLIMNIPLNKLKINDDTKVDVINLMYQKDKINNIIDNKNIYGGYHMNKKSWISIPLDNRLTNDEIIKLVNNSYLLSNNK